MAASPVNTIPAPSPLKLGGDIAADWERFKNEWNNYEIVVDLSDAAAKKRAAVFLACVMTSNSYLFQHLLWATTMAQSLSRSKPMLVPQVWDVFVCKTVSLLNTRHGP